MTVSDHFPTLFSEWTVGALTLRNRIVLSAMTTGFGYDEGVPDDDLLAYFRARTSGVGLATVAFGAVRPEGRVEKQIPWMWRPDIADRLAPLVDAIRTTGAEASLQLGHGGRQVSPKVIGRPPVGPSSLLPDVHVDVAPEALTEADIVEVIGAFGQAARAARGAGFGAVEIHAGHGYLIQQFLSPAANQRTDDYGNDPTLFGRRVIEAVRAEAPEVAVIVRVNGDDLREGGLDLDTALDAAESFAAAGADALLVSAGVYGSVPYTIPLLDDAEGCFLSLARAVRERVDVPVIGVGRITTPDTAERALTDGSVDAVAIGRALLADPDWVAKARVGALDEIRPCIATVQGCAGMLQFGEPISCAVNPEVGRERRPQPAPVEPRAVTVIGGGPAGMEAARRAAELGHEVTLFERASALGGQLRWAATTNTLAHFGRLVAWFEHQLESLGVDVRLSTSGPADSPGHVIVATGSEVDIPAIEGFELLPTWTMANLFEGEQATTGATEPSGHVVVIGSGQRTLTTALWLAERGPVTVLGRDRFGADTSGLTRRALLTRCDRAGVDLRRGTLVQVMTDGVTVGSERLPADALVLVEPLRSALPSATSGVRVGDAASPGGVDAAIASGRQAAENIG